MENKIYTHDLAAQTIEKFENLLDEQGVMLESPGDEKAADNDAHIYGSVYGDLLD